MIKKKDIIFSNLYRKYSPYLAAARLRGDWDDTNSLLKKEHEEIIQIIKDSQLRGRGGAGFSTGMKWSFMPKKKIREHYLVINADEGEPGTCKDRDILRNEPHKLIEGCLLAGFAMQSNTCYIYIRGEFGEEIEILNNAINEAYKNGLIGRST